jgi:hypothetical protein
VYGLPPDRPLTYEEYVSLTLNMTRAQCRQARPGVIAAQVAAGRLGPLEYYMLDQSDEKEGERAYEEARCRTALNRSTIR